LTEDERRAVHESFWKLKDHEAQWLHIAGLIKCSVPKKKFAAAGTKGEKHRIRTYHLVIDERLSKVCKTMFKNTLSICDSWIDSALSHVCETIVKPDLRGKHANRPKRLIVNS
jgi:phage major head subunit gpT-like protein